MKQYSNYQCYDRRGRRLSIFGEKKEGGNIELTIFKCSKKDKFSKKFGREAYKALKENKFLLNGEILNPIQEVIPGNTGKDFQNWCRTNYYHVEQIDVVFQPLLCKFMKSKLVREVNMSSKETETVLRSNMLIQYT